MPSAKPPAEDCGTSTDTYNGFTAQERAAVKEHAHEEKKAAARSGSSRAEKEAAAEQDVLAKIAEMPAADRVLAERVHKIIKTAAPVLAPKLWYGMPAYTKDGTVVCHFQSAQKFTSRYATLGFSDHAALDDGSMWATAYALRNWPRQTKNASAHSSRKRWAEAGRSRTGSYVGYVEHSVCTPDPVNRPRCGPTTAHSVPPSTPPHTAPPRAAPASTPGSRRSGTPPPKTSRPRSPTR